MPTVALPAQVDENGKPICGSKLSHPGTYGDYRCHRPPLRGIDRCRRHKGLSGVTGPAHPAYVDGRASRDRIRSKLPPRMQEDFDAAAQEAELDLSTAHLIGLVEARLLDLLGQVDAGVTAELWRELRREWDVYQRALANKGFASADDAIAAAKVALGNIERLITRGARDADVWEGIGKAIDRGMKLRDAENRRQMVAKDMVKLEHLEHKSMRLIEIIADELGQLEGGREALRRIATRMQLES